MMGTIIKMVNPIKLGDRKKDTHNAFCKPFECFIALFRILYAFQGTLFAE